SNRLPEAISAVGGRGGPSCGLAVKCCEAPARKHDGPPRPPRATPSRTTLVCCCCMSDAANQPNARLAGFLGSTPSPFDFFTLTLVIEDLAHAFFPGLPLEEVRPRIALAITLTLAMRPIGALVFGLIADRYGRRLPLMLNVLFFAVISVLCGFSQSYWQ